MADEARIVSPDMEKAKRATADAPVREYSKRALSGIAARIAKLAERNLRDRHGGGKYTRSVADIVTQDAGNDAVAVVLQTPWFGMEFGGMITNVYGRRIGTGRAEQIGLKPMWAPWHRDDRQGYIIGSAYYQETDPEKVTAEVADATLKAYSDSYDKAGLKRG